MIIREPSYKDLVWTLRQYDGRRCLWRIGVGAIVLASTVLVPLGGAMAGIYLGAPLTLGSVALAALVILLTGAWPRWINVRRPWRALLERRLGLYQTPNPRMSSSVLVAPEDGQRTALMLMHNQLYPATRRLVGRPPQSPRLTCQLWIMEPQAFQRSASSDELHDRLVRLLVAAGIDGMVGGTRVEEVACLTKNAGASSAQPHCDNAMDWTIVATAAITGLLGYGGAWLQSRTAVKQAQEETQRVRLQHREEHLRNRQGTYHEFLKVLRDYDSMMIDFAPRNDELINAWTERYGYYRAGIDLFGTPQVIDAAKRVGDVLTEASREFLRKQDEAPRHDLLSRGYGPKRAQVLTARDELVAAMRTDVAAPYAERASKDSA